MVRGLLKGGWRKGRRGRGGRGSRVGADASPACLPDFHCGPHLVFKEISPTGCEERKNEIVS